MSNVLSSCAKLDVFTLYLPYDSSSTSSLTRFLATEAFDTRSRRELKLVLLFDSYPGCIAPNAEDWRGLDDVLQLPAYRYLRIVSISQLSRIIPEKTEIVWGNTYPISKVVDQTFKNKLKALLPQTYKRRLLAWWHLFDPSGHTTVLL